MTTVFPLLIPSFSESGFPALVVGNAFRLQTFVFNEWRFGHRASQNEDTLRSTLAHCMTFWNRSLVPDASTQFVGGATSTFPDSVRSRAPKEADLRAYPHICTAPLKSPLRRHTSKQEKAVTMTRAECREYRGCRARLSDRFLHGSLNAGAGSVVRPLDLDGKA